MLGTFFIHITKTGGSTLEKILFEKYGRSQIYRFENERYRFPAQLKKLRADSNLKDNYQCFSGEVDAPAADFIGYSGMSITLLRDPIQRVISLYNFVLDNPNNFKDYEPYKGLSVRDFCDTYLKHEIHNCQTRVLSGIDFLHEDSSPEELNRNHLENAKQYLNSNKVIFGLMERFDDSVIAFKRALNWTYPVYHRTNSGKKIKREITSEDMAYIKSLNELDLELYAWAEKNFKNQLQSPWKIKFFHQPIFRFLQFLLIKKGIKFRSI